MKNFPLFIDLREKKILVFGAGTIAARRVETLLPFGPKITVIAPEVQRNLLEAEKEGSITCLLRCYRTGDVSEESFFVLAATSDPGVNKAIYEECRQKGIPVNVCSDRSLCDFQFPGIASEGDLVIGINAGGNDHHLARKWSEKIRALLKNSD